ncbi:hypothetical protein D3C78_1269350 [compost metagenome]
MLRLHRLVQNAADCARLAVFGSELLDHLHVAVEIGNRARDKALLFRRAPRSLREYRGKFDGENHIQHDPDEHRQRQLPGQGGKKRKRADHLQQKTRSDLECVDDLLLNG